VTAGYLTARAANRLFSPSLVGRVLGIHVLGDRRTAEAFTRWEFDTASGALRCFAPYDDWTGKEVLDVGCGFGGKTTWMALHNAVRVTGIDTDEEKLAGARRFAAAREADNVAFEAGDVQRLPYGDGTFDLVVFMDSFEHLDDPARALAESHRVLRPGGAALLAFPPFLSLWGAHLAEHVRIPWAHLLFSEAVVLRLWREGLSREMERGEGILSAGRCRHLLAVASVAGLRHLNGMTIGRCRQLIAGTPFTIRLLHHHAPAPLAIPARIARLQEYLVTRLTVVLLREPPGRSR
jgi:SAM-dependent methyltransferase